MTPEETACRRERDEYGFRGPAEDADGRVTVLVVDDSAMVRQVIAAIITRDKDMRTRVITASDPIIALKKMEAVRPDVIILDLDMPRMHGLEFLEKVMKENPVPTIICSGYAERGTEFAFKALEEGAVDIITKPKVGIQEFLFESAITIMDTIKAATLARIKTGRRGPRRRPGLAPAVPLPKMTADAVLPWRGAAAGCAVKERLIAIGASTGGVEALHKVLTALPDNAPGVVVVQHMPAGFTRAFAQRLDGECRIEVKEAEHGDEVRPGRALIAPGDRHMALRCQAERYKVEIIDGPLVSRHRPSVDVLFRSVAQAAGPKAVGVIMTGMGDDGAQGLLEMKRAGARTIAQDEASSVVFGMPKEAIMLGAVDQVAHLSSLSGAILRSSR